MENPVALRLSKVDSLDVFRVSIDPAVGRKLQLKRGRLAPAMIVTRKAAILPDISAGIIDGADIIAVQEGDWSEALLIVLPEPNAVEVERPAKSAGDHAFLVQVKRSDPALAELAAQVIAAVRSAGVDGELVEASGGRWVNRPLNTFTLKAQPRAGNIAFTLYGNPESYDADGFLMQDQNSYSRGWVRDLSDVKKFTDVVRQSHARRKR